MAVMSVLMTIVSTALFRMYRQQTVMVERTFQTSTWLRLNRDFRHDMHAATSVRQSEDGQRLELTTPENRIVWLADGENIRRVVPRAESPDVVETALAVSLPGELYSFPDNTVRLILTSGENEAAAVAMVEVTPPLTPNGGIVAPNLVVAAAGLDHRFANRRATQEAQP